MSQRQLILTCLLMAWAAASTPAADFYVAQNTAGNGSGTNAANALSLAWLNTAANWNGAGKVSPGDAVHFVDTLTNTLIVSGSGTVGHPITFYFEPGAKFSAPTLPNYSTWISAGGCSNLVFDGGSNGLIELTDNGTVAAHGGTMTYGHYNLAGISASGQNITAQNLTIQNLYQRQTNTEPIQGTQDSTAMFWTGSGLTVSNCLFTGCQDGLFVSYTSVATSNLMVTACTFSNFNHAFTLGAGGGQTTPLFYNACILSNKFFSGDMYETVGPDLGFHRNPIFFFDESTGYLGCISNIVVAYNFIKGGYNPQSSVAGTGAIFFDNHYDANTKHVRIYNNISTLVPPLAYSGGGGLISGFGTDVLVANNTAVAGAGQITIEGTNSYAFNNILVSGNGMWLATSADTTSAGSSSTNSAFTLSVFSGVHSDYNIFNGQGANSFYTFIYNAGGGSTWWAWLMDTFGQWTNAMPQFSWDIHSKNASVQLNGNYQPLTTDTVAIGNGTNLTAWGITNDYAGNPRPATGNWTIGAFEVPGTGGNLTLAVAALAVTSTNLNYGPVPVGNSTNLTFLVQNTSSSTIVVTDSVAAPFSIVSAPSFSLAAGQIQPVTVAYNPSTAGTNTATVTFNGGSGPVVALSGIATVSGVTARMALLPPTALRAGSAVAGASSLPTGTAAPGFGGVLGVMQALDSVASYTLIATNSAPTGSTIILFAESPSQGYPSVSTADGASWSQVYAFTNGDYYVCFVATNASISGGSTITITWPTSSYQYHQAYACYVTNCSLSDVGGYASTSYNNRLSFGNNCSAVGVGVGLFSIEAGQPLGSCSFNYVQFPTFGGPSHYLCWTNTTAGSVVLSIATPNYQGINACWVGIK